MIVVTLSVGIRKEEFACTTYTQINLYCTLGIQLGLNVYPSLGIREDEFACTLGV